MVLLLCGVKLEDETVKCANRRLKLEIGAASHTVVRLSSIWLQRPFTTDMMLHDENDTLMFAGGAARAPGLRVRGLQLHDVTVFKAGPEMSIHVYTSGAVGMDDGLLKVVYGCHSFAPDDQHNFSELVPALMRDG